MSGERFILGYPFRSRQVIELREHLSDEERMKMRSLNMKAYVWLGASFGLTESLLRSYLGPFWGSTFGNNLFSNLWSSGVESLLFGFVGAIWMIRSMKRFLAASAYAQSRDLKAKDIRWYSWIRTKV